jgi:hypothetical protein
MLRLTVLRTKPKRISVMVSKSKGQEIGVYGKNFKEEDTPRLIRKVVTIVEPENTVKSAEIAYEAWD